LTRGALVKFVLITFSIALMLSACLTMLFVNADGVFVSWTRPTDATLYSMFMVNANDGWAAGEGTILHWNGVSWTNVTSPITSDLRSVFRVSDTDCWAVGKLGTIIRWNGTAWGQNFHQPHHCRYLRGLQCFLLSCSRLTKDPLFFLHFPERRKIINIVKIVRAAALEFGHIVHLILLRQGLLDGHDKHPCCGTSMARKKVQTRSGQSVQDKNDRALKTEKDRERRIMNSVANTTIILMATMMGAFTEVMMKTTGAMASGMAEAISGKQAGEKANEEFKQKLPEVDEKIKRIISEVRKDIYAQLRQKSNQMKHLLSDPAFDTGPKTIEKYDFGLPKLTEALDAGTIAQYTQLLVSEDPNFAEMFKELTRWMETLPKLPEKNKKN